MIGPRTVDKKCFLSLAVGLIMALFSFQESVAQIRSGTADHVDTLAYLPGNSARDPLFVFYQQDEGIKPGSLTATYPDTGSYNFEWSRYNTAIKGFDPAFSIESGIKSSTVNDLEGGGYRVRIWNGTGIDTLFMSWVMLDSFRIRVAKTPEGNLPDFLYTCDFVAVAGYAFPDTLVYYDLQSHDTIYKPTGFSFQWTSDNDDLDIPNDTIVLRPNISYKPPYEDTEYTLTATDNYGMSASDEVFYESIQTRAEFSMEYYDKINGIYSADLSGDWSAENGSLDAMLTVRFLNSSLNGSMYEWVYLDTTGGIMETEITYELEANTEYTYETADKYYYPYMISNSEAGCQDTFRLLEAIHVVPSQLSIPNVFSPNGDGTNDFFVFKHQSLESCRVTIVDRSGKIVYKRKIDNIYAWEGWDGNLHDSNRRAPEGQYYYVVEALGYDGIDYRDPNIIEQWKLNRGTSSGGSTGGTNPDEPETGSDNQFTGWLYLYRNKGEF